MHALSSIDFAFALGVALLTFQLAGAQVSEGGEGPA